MASLYEHSGGHRVQFKVAGKRRTLRLGHLNAKTARKVLAMIDQMEDELALTARLSVESLAWVTAQPLVLRQRLAACGVIPREQQSVRVSVLLSEFEKGMNVKASTLEAYGHTIKNLSECYGAATPVDEVTDGKAFEQFLKMQQYSRATTGRRIKAARTIWTWAVENGYASANPFKSIEAPAQVNPARKAYIGREIIAGIIDADTDPEFKLILALARFSGLRCPSEIAALKWSHVDWNAGTLTVPSPKTEHHEHGASRIIPIFADVLPHLRAVFDQTTGEYVIDRLRDSTGNAWTNKLRKRLKKSGIAQWPRLWQNLRASCATDLAAEYRMPVVAAWMGHGVMVSQTHYQIVTGSDIAHARGAVQNATFDGGAKTQIPASKPRFSSQEAGIMGVKGRRKRQLAGENDAPGAISDVQRRLQIQLAQAYRRVMARASRRQGVSA